MVWNVVPTVVWTPNAGTICCPTVVWTPDAGTICCPTVVWAPDAGTPEGAVLSNMCATPYTMTTLSC